MKYMKSFALVIATMAMVLVGCQSGYDADGATVTPRPNAESAHNLAPTVIGEVTDIESNALHLDTPKGTEIIQITPQTTGEETATVGDLIAVDVNRTTTGVAVASVVRQPTTEELEAWEMNGRDVGRM